MADIKDDIFNFVFVMAMRDAVMQKAYEGEKIWLYEDGEKCKEWRDQLKNFVDTCLEKGFDTNKAYDKAFYDTAEAIQQSINSLEQGMYKTSKFTFGNAQKLINMTMKYFYIASYCNKDIREKFRYCHCPMDGIMLEYVYTTENHPELINKKTWFTDSWSKEGNETDPKEDGKYCRYKKFQKIVNEVKLKEDFPIEFDYRNWGKKKNI